MKQQWMTLLGALALWLLAIIGAIGVSMILQLQFEEAQLLVGIAGIVAVISTVIPVLRAGSKRK